jgi:hypothetical protein
MSLDAPVGFFRHGKLIFRVPRWGPEQNPEGTAGTRIVAPWLPCLRGQSLYCNHWETRPVIHPFQSKEPRWHDDRRQQMIAETNAWLTWAVQHDHEIPKIPTRRVDRGGFTTMFQNEGAKSAVCHWWSTTVDRIGSLTDR